MTARSTSLRLVALGVIAAAVMAALTVAPRPAGAEVAQSADAAGDAYREDVAKAKRNRNAKLRKCKGKPTKAKRRACSKAARQAFRRAKARAKAKRDKARERSRRRDDRGKRGGEPDGPLSPRERHDAFRECVQKEGSIYPCLKLKRR